MQGKNRDRAVGINDFQINLFLGNTDIIFSMGIEYKKFELALSIGHQFEVVSGPMLSKFVEHSTTQGLVNMEGSMLMGMIGTANQRQTESKDDE